MSEVMEECKDCDQSVGYTCVGCEFGRLDHMLKEKDQRINQLEDALRDMGNCKSYFDMRKAKETHKEILDTINKRGEE